jgi:hypothetical protein
MPPSPVTLVQDLATAPEPAPSDSLLSLLGLPFLAAAPPAPPLAPFAWQPKRRRLTGACPSSRSSLQASFLSSPVVDSQNRVANHTLDPKALQLTGAHSTLHTSRIGEPSTALTRIQALPSG